MDGPSFADTSGMVDIVSEMGSGYEFVFLTAPYGGRGGKLWIRDPPGGKSSPTDDPNWDALSIDAIDAVVASQGPFYGILGYSQGTAMTISYLAQAPNNTFVIGLVFCAYVPSTHLGLVGRIEAAAPFSIPMFIYMSTRDWIIDNCMTNVFATKFVSPTRATSSEGGHSVPPSGAQGFSGAVAFLRANHTDGSWVVPPPSPTELQLTDCPNILIILLRDPTYLALFICTLLCCCCCYSCCGYGLYRCCGNSYVAVEQEQCIEDDNAEQSVAMSHPPPPPPPPPSLPQGSITPTTEPTEKEYT